MLLLSLSLSEREGGGGAPTFLGVGCRGCAEKSRAGAGDRPGVGTVGLGWRVWRAPQGHAQVDLMIAL